MFNGSQICKILHSVNIWTECNIQLIKLSFKTIIYVAYIPSLTKSCWKITEWKQFFTLTIFFSGWSRAFVCWLDKINNGYDSITIRIILIRLFKLIVQTQNVTCNFDAKGYSENLSTLLIKNSKGNEKKMWRRIGKESRSSK